MAVLPSYVTVLFQDLAEGFDAEVEEFKSERGLSKLRVTNSRVVVSVPVKLRTQTRAESLAFDTWYFDTIKEVGWFTFRHPRTGQLVTASIVELGTRVPLAGQYAVASQPVTLEYMR